MSERYIQAPAIARYRMPREVQAVSNSPGSLGPTATDRYQAYTQMEQAEHGGPGTKLMKGYSRRLGSYEGDHIDD